MDTKQDQPYKHTTWIPRSNDVETICKEPKSKDVKSAPKRRRAS